MMDSAKKGRFHSGNTEFSRFQRKILNYSAYFGISTGRIFFKAGEKTVSEKYTIESTTQFAKVMYWILTVNAVIKFVFLIFLVLGFFGGIDFLDFIAALDYILCFNLVVITASIWYRKFPLYEILKGSWNSLNNIYVKLGAPVQLKSSVDLLQKSILISHSAIILVGCTCLMIQYVADPKYTTFTYSLIGTDTAVLRFLFGAHEFLFMNLAWNTYAGSCSLCIFQGVALSNVINKMTENILFLRRKENENKIELGKSKENPCNIYQRLLEYKQLTIICNQFNDWVAYKTMFLHICGGCQFVSDVFTGTHIMKLPGAGFMDVWFYIEDCFAAGFILLRTYVFMALVSTASESFLRALKEYIVFRSERRKELRKVARSLHVISLNVGPCSISPMSVLTVLNNMGNYYVVAALW